jgi:hypothetical protein
MGVSVCASDVLLPLSNTNLSWITNTRGIYLCRRARITPSGLVGGYRWENHHGGYPWKPFVRPER